MTMPGLARGPLPATAPAVIVGGGITGVALGYELARRGMRNVCVLDAAYPGAGASGRNGELVRSAFASREWATLFDISLRKWLHLSDELDTNVMFTRAGYLVLASTDEQMALCRRSVARHAELGIGTELLDEAGVRRRVPALAHGYAQGGFFQRDGGFAHHDAVVWGYVAAAARLGVAIHAGVTATGITVDAGRVTGVTTSAGPIATPVVVDAAGGRAREVAALAGVEIPTTTQRLEALVTESMPPFLRPGVALLAALGYAHQTTRGEFVGGTEIHGVQPPDTMRTSLAGLADAATKFTAAFPLLRSVRVIRQWAGIVDVSPDFAPLLGPAPAVEGLWLDCGWVYGFMAGPGAALLLAEAVTTGRVPAALAPFTVERFARGEPIVEASLVVEAMP
ncbi:MAG: FAD-dependent oxidoreductase [Chloroflexota bacterium]